MQEGQHGLICRSRSSPPYANFFLTVAFRRLFHAPVRRTSTRGISFRLSTCAARCACISEPPTLRTCSWFCELATPSLWFSQINNSIYETSSINSNSQCDHLYL
ncbi:hypothetical protein AVEN_251888-1 [Araneus ventricosus]|uniref:Uncharacterized protein n=1 Tax=Araneus ventricosus TaxID=182803 RepID=A0A4Y1ZK02_ARAVE|nr:hypothetical protein AVEN_251888-1 [Araneus ventricosus]